MTVPALAITASGPNQQRGALAAGFTAWLPKPLDLLVFCEAVAKPMHAAAALE